VALWGLQGFLVECKPGSQTINTQFFLAGLRGPTFFWVPSGSDGRKKMEGLVPAHICGGLELGGGSY